MAIATMTAKGQVTVPKEVRERAGLRPGDRVDFQINDDGLITIRPCNKTISQIRGIIKTTITLSVEEIDDAIAGYHGNHP